MARCVWRMVAMTVVLLIVIGCAPRRGDEAGAGGQGASRPGPLVVFAAASLTGPLREIAQQFEADRGVEVRLSFASSGTLARQIEQGAAVDVFLSASQQWADYAAERGLVDAASRRPVLANAVVLVQPDGNPPMDVGFESGFPLPSRFDGRFVIGDPDHVPAGSYAKEAMGHYGWWAPLEQRLILAKDVRQALMIVERGEAQLGTCYASDAVTSDRVNVAGVFPDSSHRPIRYVGAVCKEAHPMSSDLLDHLRGGRARAVFERYGFVTVFDESEEAK